MRDTYGHLYTGLKLDYFWWEVVDSLRKVAILAVAVFLHTAGVVTQTAAVVTVCFFALCLQMK